MSVAEVPPDQTVDIPAFVGKVDKRRCLPPGADRDFPDAVWVAVCATSWDESGGGEARRLANQYVARKYQEPSPGVDLQHGPVVDDGSQVAPPAAGVGSTPREFGASEYLRMAARQTMTAQAAGGGDRFVTFFRVRRSTSLGV